jgi:hypothetical protein
MILPFGRLCANEAVPSTGSIAQIYLVFFSFSMSVSFRFDAVSSPTIWYEGVREVNLSTR